jgi:RPA family protein
LKTTKITRQPSKRIHIKKIFECYIDESQTPRVLQSNAGEKYFRIKILGIVVNKYTKKFIGQNLSDNKINENNSTSSYTAIELDDNTGIIGIRAWREEAEALNCFQIGDILEVSGRPKEYQGLIYIQYEQARIIEDPHWLLFHELEIIKNKFKSIETKRKQISLDQINNKLEDEESLGSNGILKTDLSNFEDKPDSDLESKILGIIAKDKTNKGVSFKSITNKLLNSDKKEVKDGLINLLNEGLIYEPKPKLYKKI